MANWETEFVKIIKEICSEESVTISSFDDWAFVLEKADKRGFIYGYQFGLDSASTANVLKDKAAASEMMEKAGIPHIPHWCVMSPAAPEFCSLDSGWTFLEKALEKYGELVVKDNLGTGGRLVFCVRSKKELEKACHDIFLTAPSLAVSPYVKIQEEYRLIMLDGELSVAFMKKRPSLVGDGKRTVKELLCDKIMGLDDKELLNMLTYEKQPKAFTASLKGSAVPKKDSEVLLEWKHNLGQGSKPEVVKDSVLLEELVSLAEKAVDFFGLRFASVDIVKAGDSFRILEINSGVMMENLAKTDEILRKRTKETYRKAIRLMLQ